VIRHLSGGMMRASWGCAALCIGIIAIGACSQNNSGPETNQRMMMSSKNFDLGRTDGQRDAKSAWTEDGAYWMWLWAAEESYQAGYKQGWKEGRAEVANQRQAEQGQKLNERNENTGNGE